jgi:predicted transcriptional regulator
MHHLSEEDYEKAKLMQTLGLTRPLSHTIIYLLEEPGFSKDIEEGTGLKQPEVSTAVRKLRDLGWLEEEKIHDGGSGRPKVMFSLSADKEAILEYSIKDAVEKMRSTEENIHRLEQLLTS